jgi:hypothetical protein
LEPEAEEGVVVGGRHGWRNELWLVHHKRPLTIPFFV